MAFLVAGHQEECKHRQGKDCVSVGHGGVAMGIQGRPYRKPESRWCLERSGAGPVAPSSLCHLDPGRGSLGTPGGPSAPGSLGSPCSARLAFGFAGESPDPSSPCVA